MKKTLILTLLVATVSCNAADNHANHNHEQALPVQDNAATESIVVEELKTPTITIQDGNAEGENLSLEENGDLEVSDKEAVDVTDKSVASTENTNQQTNN